MNARGLRRHVTEEKCLQAPCWAPFFIEHCAVTPPRLSAGAVHSPQLETRVRSDASCSSSRTRTDEGMSDGKGDRDRGRQCEVRILCSTFSFSCRMAKLLSCLVARGRGPMAERWKGGRGQRDTSSVASPDPLVRTGPFRGIGGSLPQRGPSMPRVDEQFAPRSYRQGPRWLTDWLLNLACRTRYQASLTTILTFAPTMGFVRTSNSPALELRI